MSFFTKKTLLLFSIILVVFISFYTYKNDPRHHEKLDTSLPFFVIDTESFEPLNEKDSSFATASFIDENNRYVINEVPVNIRFRGNSTFELDKKPYKLTFYNNVDLLQDGENLGTEWVLLADYFDKSLLRNYTALSLSNIFSGLNFTSNFRLVELVLNGEHLGTFLLAEQISTSLLELGSGDVLLERTVVYKQEETIFIDEAYSTVSYDVRSDITSDNMIRIENLLYDIEEFLISNDQEMLSSLIDIDSCVDYYLVQELMRNTDAGYGSCYMYIYQDEDKFYFGPPWDFDLSAGISFISNDNVSENSFTESFTSSSVSGTVHTLFFNLCQNDWFQDLVTSRYTELRPKILNTLNEVSEISSLYNVEFERNLDLWNLNEASQAFHFEAFYDWFISRINWLDEYFTHFNQIIE